MATMRNGMMFADPVPALIDQVLTHVLTVPPVKPEEIGHACFPGHMVGCQYKDNEWLSRLKELSEMVDSRMQVLHACNLVWRRTTKRKVTENGVLREDIQCAYYRPNDRRAMATLPEDIRWLPFHEIKPYTDDRFPPVH